MKIKLLVCGGRYYSDYAKVCEILDPLVPNVGILIEGGAKGADSLANHWACSKGIHTARVPALWSYYDRAAGGVRNSTMLLLKPDWFVAFPGGPGTADMVKKLRAAGVPGLAL